MDLVDTVTTYLFLTFFSSRKGRSDEKLRNGSNIRFKNGITIPTDFHY